VQDQFILETWWDQHDRARPNVLSQALKPLPPKYATNLENPSMSLRSLEYRWLEHVRLTEEIDNSVHITWSAYNASQVMDHQMEVSVSALMPLLRDKAQEISTVKHAMDKIKEALAYLNPSQTPVISADQPLFALIKQIQWQWPQKYGNYVALMGGLHTEMAALRMIGRMLKGSGWTAALENAGIASSGTTESFLSAACVTKTRRAHQITACALYVCMQSTFSSVDLDASSDASAGTSFEEWRTAMCSSLPNFEYWSTILNAELDMLSFIRALREGNFAAYKESLMTLLPYFFSSDSTHYSRWLTIHLLDMMTLQQKFPDVYEQFMEGKFVI